MWFVIARSLRRQTVFANRECTPHRHPTGNIDRSSHKTVVAAVLAWRMRFLGFDSVIGDF
jgi:hypothetical protein